jgi:hypothetical protein
MELARAGKDFKPTATYDPDGDCVEFLARPDPFYAERIDDLVTVYYSQIDNEIVGSLIKGVSGFCERFAEKMPGFRIEIVDGRVKLVHIFRAKMWTLEDSDQIKTITYRKLIAAAEESEVETEICVH